MGKTVPKLDIFCQQVKAVPGMGYVQFNHWPKAHYGNPRTSQAIAKVSSLQTNGKAIALKTTLTYLFEHKEVKKVPSPLLTSGVLEGTLHTTKGEGSQHSYKPYDLRQ